MMGTRWLEELYKLNKIWIDQANQERLSDMTHEKKKMTRAEAIKCFDKHTLWPSDNTEGLIDFYIEVGMLDIVEEPTVKVKHIDVIDKEFVIIKRNGVIVYQDT